jgi:hypothetical protein
MARVLWTQRQDVGPSPRGGHALAYDATRGRVVLFGGRAAGERLQGDTWEWDGHDWTQVADTGPDARAGHALAFDAARERIMLFGGEAAGPTLRADTWAWDGEDWTQVADTGPDARVGHALAFDAPRGRVVLFGGESAGPTLQGDSWEWDGGAEWTQVADTGPAARRDHGMTFDVAHGRVVLFGGAVASGDANDTWAWDGSEWTQVADMGPLPSRAVGMTFAGAATLLFGGISSAPALATEQLSRLSWEWDGEHWTLRQDMGPTPRWGHALAFDSQRGRPVLFGGVSVLPGDANVASSVLGDTWEAKLEEVAPPAGSPTLVSFTLNPDTIDGAGGGTISLEVVIDRPAPPGGASVSILMQGQELLADPILVGEGQATGTVFIELSGGPSNFLPPGDHTLEARLNGSSVTAVLHIL